MASQYLQSSDYGLYGVSDADQPAITQASALMDAFMSRPAGLVYSADANGNPCQMVALTPTLTLTSTAAFGPGNGITVGVSGPLAMVQVGDVVVIDRESSTLTEAVQVTSLDTTGMTVTLGSTAANQPSGIQFAHGIGATMDLGMVITENRYMPKGRSEVVLANAPVARVVGGTGRYAYGRRGDSASYDMDNFNLLASLNKFGGPPAWEIWPANSAAGIDTVTGTLWVPAGIMLAYYSEVRVRYVSGYTYANLPSSIKQACAQIVQANSNNPVLGNVKSYKAGDTVIEQFSASILSDDVKMMLKPWRARLFA